MLLKLELSHQKIRFGCLFRSSCTQHSRRAAPLDPSPVMQSCAARLNASLTKQSVNCELLCIIPLSTFTTSESKRSTRLHIRDSGFPFACRQFGKPLYANV